MGITKVITVACEKGGVGKTTIATNLAIYLKAMKEELPITIFSFDKDFTIDKMFSFNREHHAKSIKDIYNSQALTDLVEMGQYGVNYIPSSVNTSSPREEYEMLASRLAESYIDGIVIIDTQPILDFYTKSAILASDMVLAPIKDLASLNNMKSIAEFCEKSCQTPPILKLIPSLIDGMVKFKDNLTMDELLRSIATKRGYDLMESSIAKSPKVESLATNLSLQTYPIITHAKNTHVHKNFISLTKEILSILDDISEAKRTNKYKDQIFSHNADKNRLYKMLMETILPYCPLCGIKSISEASNVRSNMLYFESSTNIRGFIDRNCFIKHILEEFVSVGGDALGLRNKLLEEINNDVFLCINSFGVKNDNDSIRSTFTLYDFQGEEIYEGTAKCFHSSSLGALLRRITEDVPQITGSIINKILGSALRKTMAEVSFDLSQCILKFGIERFPDVILLDKNYKKFQSLKEKIMITSAKKAINDQRNQFSSGSFLH